MAIEPEVAVKPEVALEPEVAVEAPSSRLRSKHTWKKRGESQSGTNILSSTFPEDTSTPSLDPFHEIRHLLGVRVTVRGDGSCWMYSFMAGLGILEHANPVPVDDSSQRERQPTKRDYSPVTWGWYHYAPL